MNLYEKLCQNRLSHMGSQCHFFGQEDLRSCFIFIYLFGATYDLVHKCLSYNLKFKFSKLPPFLISLRFWWSHLPPSWSLGFVVLFVHCLLLLLQGISLLLEFSLHFNHPHCRFCCVIYCFFLECIAKMCSSMKCLYKV